MEKQIFISLSVDELQSIIITAVKLALSEKAKNLTMTVGEFIHSQPIKPLNELVFIRMLNVLKYMFSENTLLSSITKDSFMSCRNSGLKTWNEFEYERNML